MKSPKENPMFWFWLVFTVSLLLLGRWLGFSWEELLSYGV